MEDPASGLRLESLRTTREHTGGLVKVTPLLPAEALSHDSGARDVRLKVESLQATGSFKLRGAAAKLGAVEHKGRGVTAGSAGNHGLALAYTAQRFKLPCSIHMPVMAPVSKVQAVERLGASVIQEQGSVDECIERARQHAEADGLLFVHPFDDPDVIRGNAGIGLELADRLEDLAQVIVPVGGGGLAAGIGIAVKQTLPNCRVVGVQADACAPFAQPSVELDAGAVRTIADGIAVKRPGELTRGLLERWIDELVVVGEDAIAEAVVYLAEHNKLVAEGAGAVGVAALLEGKLIPETSGATAVVISGGNIDPRVLAAVVDRHESRVGRRVRISTRVPDHPGGLAALLQTIANAGGNVIEVVHVRESRELHVDQTDVELVLETRGTEHIARIRDQLSTAGYTL